MLGVPITVQPRALVPRTGELVQLLRWRVDAAAGTRVVVAVQPLPIKLERAIRSSGGMDRLSDPAFRILGYLLVNPALQALFISRGPAFTPQCFTREVVLRVFLDLGYGLVIEVGRNDLQARCYHIFAALHAQGVVVQSALQNVEVPENLPGVNAVVVVTALILSPFVLRQVLR